MKRAFSGFIYTWGDSYNYNLGHLTRQPIYSPRKLDRCYKEIVLNGLNDRLEADQLRRDKPLLFKFSSISTGPFHTICITEQGQLYSFGDERYIKLGHEATNMLPDRILGLSGSTIKSAACGLHHSLALSNIGRVFSWGYGGEADSMIYTMIFNETPGALGHGDFRNYYIPTLIESLEDVFQIEAGFHHSLALTSNYYIDSGHLFSWGSNEFWQLGYAAENSSTPRPVPLSNIRKISAARDYSVALNHIGEVFVWGYNHYGQLGTDQKIIKSPLKIASNCLDIEAGEGALALVFENHIEIAGFKKYQRFCELPLPSKPVDIAVGDLFLAYVDRFGEVFSVGGLFTSEKRKFFFIKSPDLRFEKAEAGFFPGKVKSIKGKYSYHAVIIDS